MTSTIKTFLHRDGLNLNIITNYKVLINLWYLDLSISDIILDNLDNLLWHKV